MQWRLTLEAIDPAGDRYQDQFSFDKDIGRLPDGELGCSLEDDNTILAEIQRIVVQREIDLHLEFRRICFDCQSRHWVKDRRNRKIKSVFAIVEVESPRYRICQIKRPNFTTLRNRTVKDGQTIQDADFDRWWHELRDKKHHEPQNELPLANDLNRETVLSIDMAFVPRRKRSGGLTFEAVVCYISRGGPGQSAGPVFAFAGTDRWKLKAHATKANPRSRI